MTKKEYQKYLDLIASMTIDAKMGGITQETYINNLVAIVKIMNEPKDIKCNQIFVTKEIIEIDGRIIGFVDKICDIEYFEEEPNKVKSLTLTRYIKDSKIAEKELVQYKVA